MGHENIEQATERFMASVVEIRGRIDDYLSRVAADDWKDAAELLITIQEIGRAGARVYNATKAMAGGSPFSLDDVVRSLRSRDKRE